MGTVIFVTILFFIMHVVVYLGAFRVTIGDDIEMNCGKKALKKYYKKRTLHVWQKYFFVGMIKHIKPFTIFSLLLIMSVSR